MKKIDCFIPFAGKEQAEKDSTRITGYRSYRQHPFSNDRPYARTIARL